MVDFPWTQSYPAGVRWDAELPLMPVQKILDDAVVGDHVKDRDSATGAKHPGDLGDMTFRIGEVFDDV